MSISAGTRRLVRDRAHFACEFCTVTETDTGGELTIDYTNNKRLCWKKTAFCLRSNDVYCVSF